MERLTNETLKNAIDAYETTIEAYSGYENDESLEEYCFALDRVTVSFLKELQEYRKLEEQGLLLKLPCKVGDKLYKPYYFNRKAKGIDTIVVSNMVVEFDSEEGERAYIVGHYENTNCGVDADFSEIGEVVHIHKAEAEKALAEMEK